jgi:hypothetical protein
MGVILPLLWMLGMCFSVSFILKRNFEESIPIALLFGILVIYIGTLFINLNFGIFITLIIEFSSILYFILKADEKKLEIKRFLSNGFIVFVVLYAFVTILNWQRGLTMWDEFSHWGPMIKEILRSNEFYNVNPPYEIIHMDYPPIIPLFEAMWCKISGGFAEAYCYRAIQMFTFSLMFPIIGLFKKKNKLYTIIISLVVMIMLSVSSNIGNSFFYQGIYIDSFLGYIIGYSLISVYLKKGSYIDVVLSLSVLLLVKEISLVFYLMIIVYYFINNKFDFKKLLMVVVIPLVFYFSWKFELDFYNVNYSGFTLHSFILNSDILDRYIGNILYFKMTSGFISLSYFKIILLTASVILTGVYFNKEKRISNIKLAIIYIVGSIGYGITMLILYHVAFSLHEASYLASYDRYMGSYVIASIYLIVVVILKNFHFTKYYTELVVLILLFSLISFNSFKNLKPIVTYKGATDGFVSDFNEISYFAEDNDRVFITDQYGNGYRGLILKYMLFPDIISYDSIGEPKNSGDIWSKNYSEEEWEQILINNDYLYIYGVSDEDLLEYLDKYIDINNVEAHKMYFINKSGGKIVLDKLDIY